MKILAISDPHYHNYKSHSRLIEGVNSRLIDIENAVSEAVSIGEAEGCELMVVCGDVFHVRGTIRPSVFNRVHRQIEGIARKMPVVIIPGNHDMEHFRDGETSVYSLESISNVYVFKGPGYLTLRGVRILGVPYVHDHEEFKRVFAEELAVDGSKADIAMIHQGIDDFDETGILQTGLTVGWLLDRVPSGMPVLSGHYHTPRASHEKCGNVIMVGAPIQHSFGDEGNPRGCWVLEVEDGHVLKTEFYQISGPEFHTVRGAEDIDGKDLAGCFVRVKSTKLTEARKLAALCDAAGALDIVVQIEKDFEPSHEKTIRLSTDIEGMIAQYVKIVGGEWESALEDILKYYRETCS